jgi:hypothetical protein
MALMSWFITKYLLTAAVVVLISEAAKRSERLGGLIAALPMVAILAMVWMHVEGQPRDRIADFTRYLVWYVVATLPMFMAFPHLLPRLGFWATLVCGIFMTLACFGLVVLVARQFGVELLA